MSEKLLVRYLRDRLRVIAAFAVVSLVFAVVLYLYALPNEPVLYCAALCAAGALIYAAIDFTVYLRKHRLLSQMRRTPGLNLGSLPPAHGLIETDYRELVLELQAEAARLTAEADRLADDMTDYYTMWAHQIKTPIAAMGLLLQSGGDQKAALSAELFKIEQYVEMVLCYTRLESRSTDYVLVSCPLDGIIRQALRKYSRLFILKGIALDYQGTDEVALTDEKWLLFVIEQLTSNAVKYTNQGGITIEVTDGPMLVIRDSGIGIPAQDLQRVFEKGYTGYNGRIDQRATGLGLYLCRRILTNLNHTIRLESEVGHGTSVIVGLGRPEFDADV